MIELILLICIYISIKFMVSRMSFEQKLDFYFFSFLIIILLLFLFIILIIVGYVIHIL